MRERNPEDFKLRIQSFPSRALAYGLRERPSLVWEAEKAFLTNSQRIWDMSTFSMKPLQRERRDNRRQATSRSFFSRQWPAHGYM
jgi:hypothetical protein